MKNSSPLNNSAQISRYPGVAPFAAEQREVFFGRTQDIKRLGDLIHRQPQVLLYAKSGLGKSSLINAGVLPQLLEREPDLQILHVRFGAYVEGTTRSPIQAVVESLEQAALPTDYSLLDRVFAADKSLWYHFKARQLAEAERRFLLVFDQFEELFSYPQEQVLYFKRQMHDLLYRPMPLHFEKALLNKQKKQADLLNPSEEQRLAETQQIKLLLAIREDRYSLLHSLTDFLPDLLRHRYALEPLTSQQAKEAIEAPAAADSPLYRSAPFSYSPAALEKILNYLTQGGKREVETTQLQILCSRLEGLGLAEIGEKDIPRFQDIFLDYYYDSLAKLPDTLRLPVRQFIETQLLQKGQRISLDSLLLPAFMDDKVLGILVQEQHLLRAERNSTGGISYELSHDTLVGPIMEAYEQRSREEEAEAQRLAAIEAERQAKRAAEELAKQKRQLRNARLLLAFALVGLVLAGIATVFAFRASNEANEKAIEAAKATEVAADEAAKAQREKEAANSAKAEADENAKKAEEAGKLAQDKAKEAAAEATNAQRQKIEADKAKAKAEASLLINQLNYNDAANFRLPRLFIEGNNYVDVGFWGKADDVIREIEEELKLIQPLKPDALSNPEDRQRFFFNNPDPRDRSGKTMRQADFWVVMKADYERALRDLKARRAKGGS